jgi:hypothetical protein
MCLASALCPLPIALAILLWPLSTARAALPCPHQRPCCVTAHPAVPSSTHALCHRAPRCALINAHAVSPCTLLLHLPPHRALVAVCAMLPCTPQSHVPPCHAVAQATHFAATTTTTAVTTPQQRNCHNHRNTPPPQQTMTTATRHDCHFLAHVELLYPSIILEIYLFEPIDCMNLQSVASLCVI